MPSYKAGSSVSVTAVQRLKKDYMRIMKDPVPYVLAAPLHENMLEWRYVVRGAPGTPYEGGVYHGKLVFPSEFPFKPPSIYMLTPNGRFQVNQRLCLSISDFHPDTWNPAWTVSTILNGLLSFMNENQQTFGSVNSSDFEKRALAKRSRDFNLKDKTFCDLFDTLAAELKEERQKEMEAAAAQSADSQTSSAADKTRITSGGAAVDGANGGLLAIFEHHITYNLLVVAGVVALAFAVKYVLANAESLD